MARVLRHLQQRHPGARAKRRRPGTQISVLALYGGQGCLGRSAAYCLGPGLRRDDFPRNVGGRVFANSELLRQSVNSGVHLRRLIS
jgi:hypothetical protein